QNWRQAFAEPGAFTPLLHLLSPFPTLVRSTGASGGTGSGSVASTVAVAIGSRGRPDRRPSLIGTTGSSITGGVGATGGAGGSLLRARVDSGAGHGADNRVGGGGEDSDVNQMMQAQVARMLQVFIVGSAAVASADPSATTFMSTSAGCTPDHLASLTGFVLRCHLEAEELVDLSRNHVLSS
ncbi:unnamed protein product, partial [Choristocarpus tenellus]